MTTCADLEPLLRDTWTSDRAAWSVLVAERSRVEAAVRRAWVRWQRPHHVEVGDLLAEAQLRIIRKAAREQGLSRPPDCEHRDPALWLATVLKHHVHDAIKGDAGQRDSRFVTVSDGLDEDAVSTALRHAPAVSRDPSEVVQERQELETLRERIASLRGPATYRLAVVLFSWPSLLDRALVDDACEHRHGKASGVLRPADDVWRELGAWADRHAWDPQSDASRQHLAWILRSDDDSDPVRWRASHPDAVADARDTLRKWYERGVRALMEGA